MGRYCGKIGYIESAEDPNEPGYWVNSIIEKTAIGDITRNIVRSQAQNNNVNDDIISNNMISIIADPYAQNNFQHIVYATYMGTRWKVNSVEVEYPRLLLSLGGVYNG